MRKTATGAVAVAIAALAATGCGSSSPTPSAGSSHPAPHAGKGSSPAVWHRPANPVPILAKTGVTPDGEGAQVDVYGDHFADGTFSSGEDVTVWTFSSQAALDADLARNAHPTDGARVAVGHLFAVSIVGVLPDGSPAGDIDMRPESDQAAARAAITYPVSPAVIAQRTGTTLRPAG